MYFFQRLSVFFPSNEAVEPDTYNHPSEGPGFFFNFDKYVLVRIIHAFRSSINFAKSRARRSALISVSESPSLFASAARFVSSPTFEVVLPFILERRLLKYSATLPVTPKYPSWIHGYFSASDFVLSPARISLSIR